MSNENEESLEKLTKVVNARNNIVHYPTPSLKTPCLDVPMGMLKQESFLSVVRKMTSTMMDLEAYGVAGPQVGFNYRIFVAWFNAREPEDVQVFINPVVLDIAGTWEAAEEGCLSLPKVQGTIRRRSVIKVKSYDMDGFEWEDTYEGWNARIVQHELDHLNGKLIIDKFSDADKLVNRNSIERLKIRMGILPERLSRKGYKIKKNADIS